MWLMNNDCFINASNLPPTLYYLMDSLVNYGQPVQTKASELWKKARKTIFDFDYNISDVLGKEEFEHRFLNHFIARRINAETFGMWHIMLEDKLIRVLPKYNNMLDMFNTLDILQGEKTERTYNGKTDNSNNKTITGTTENTNLTTAQTDNKTTYERANENENKFSDTPQNAIEDIKNGEYLTEFTDNTTKENSTTDTSTIGSTRNTGESTQNTKENNIFGATKEDKEVMTKTVGNRLEVYLKYQNEINNILDMIFKDLEPLFYGILE